MTWGYDNREGRVTCDHHGCDARVTHPRENLSWCDGVSACTYAADRALSLGWDVLSDIEHSDLCPTHRGMPAGSLDGMPASDVDALFAPVVRDTRPCDLCDRTPEGEVCAGCDGAGEVPT